eukprot:TRINITY_DN6395_c0_g1_i1.p1 TRINITY_DN6395_c0_g1~~TRINITY_DN6395_c0_g1_i1.p1  ORF type:complete len:315 (-),score=83.26 TRINITY_DN6395_c0_g1_i1:24-968(-)
MSEEEFDDQPAICIDNGSGSVKAGFSGDNLPKLIFPSICGKTKSKYKKEDPNLKDIYVGDEIYQFEEKLSIKYPVETGIVSDWDLAEQLWSYTFEKLEVDPENRKVFLTEPPNNPKENKEKMAEIIFEKFLAGNLHIGMQAVMSLYSAGRTTGVVLDIGDGVAHTVPVSEGFIIPHNIRRVDLAGRDLTGYLAVLLAKRDYNFTTGSEMQVVKKIKEKTCYVALDYAKELDSELKSVEFELPDKKIITLDQERFKCLEPLFKPAIIEMESPGVQHIVQDTVMKCDIDLRKEMFDNVVLSGGTTSAPGKHQKNFI